MDSKQRKVINEAADIILSELAAPGDKVTIRGFGTFKRVSKPERTARNPQTGEAVIVPPKDVIRFKQVKAQ